MDSFKTNLLDQFAFIKQGEFEFKDVKKSLNEIPDGFIMDNKLLKEMFQAMNTVTTNGNSMVKEEFLQIFHILFDYIQNYGKAVIGYFESCSEHDDGPMGINNFDIDENVKEIEKYYGDDITIEKGLELSKLFALALIGDTKQCLEHFCTQIVSTPKQMLDFICPVFEHLQPVSEYSANFKNVKGSLILATMNKVIQDNHEQSSAIQHTLLRIVIPRKKNHSSLVPPNLMFEHILEQLIKKEMIELWVPLFGSFIRELKKNKIDIGFDSLADTMLNPTYLSVFLMKILYSKDVPRFDYEEIFKSLGELFQAQDIQFIDTTAFRGCEEIDWATKFAIMDLLQIPTTSFRREIPVALYFGLSDETKKDYIKLEDTTPNLENYLTALFELALVADKIPDEFINDAAAKFPTTFDITFCIAHCFYRACQNVSMIRDFPFKESIFKIFGKLLQIFDCKIELGGATPLTPNFLNEIIKIQPCLLIVRAASCGICEYKIQNPSRNSMVDYRKLEPSTYRLLFKFLELAKDFILPYHDELRKAVDESIKLSPSRLSLMFASYVLLQKRVNSISTILDNSPDELKLFNDRLQEFNELYTKYGQIYFPYIQSNMYELQRTPQPGRQFARKNVSTKQQQISQPKIQQFQKSTNGNVHEGQKLPLQQTSENPLPEKPQIEQTVNDQHSSQTTLNDQSIEKQVRKVHQTPMQQTSDNPLPEKPQIEQTVNDQNSSQTTLTDHSSEKQVPEVHQIPIRRRFVNVEPKNRPSNSVPSELQPTSETLLPEKSVNVPAADKHSLEAILPTSTIKEQPLPNETLPPQNVVPLDQSEFVIQSAQNNPLFFDSPEIQPSVIEEKNDDASIDPFNVPQTLNIPSINGCPNGNQLNQNGGYERSKIVIDTSSNTRDFANCSTERIAAIPNPSDSIITNKEPLQRLSETKTFDDVSKPVASVVIPQLQCEPKKSEGVAESVSKSGEGVAESVSKFGGSIIPQSKRRFTTLAPPVQEGPAPSKKVNLLPSRPKPPLLQRANNVSFGQRGFTSDAQIYKPIRPPDAATIAMWEETRNREPIKGMGLFPLVLQDYPPENE
uniref:Uncharacterized protein n=1 Tax=Panagrolaimus davidi TaxID=227884 RepID=A0A914PK02_9BILA